MSSNPPTQTVWVAGQVAVVQGLQAASDGVSFLTGGARVGQPRRPYCILNQTVSQSLANNASTTILFDSEEVDTDGGHSTSATTGQYAVQTSGWYDLRATVLFAANATGTRRAAFQINGTGRFYGEQSGGAAPTYESAVNISDVVYIAAGSYVIVVALQTSGAALSTATGPQGCRLVVKWDSLQ
jgi:hypothetical protein